MLIYIQEVKGKRYEIDVEPTTSISELKLKLFDLTGLPVDQQRLIFAGKQLEYDGQLCEYNIQRESTLHLVARVVTPRRREVTPSETVFPERNEVRANIQAWKTKAKEGHFDEDICIVDPQAYYGELSYLEADVVEASELYNTKGTYSNAFNDTIVDSTSHHEQLRLIPDWMNDFIESKPIQKSMENWDSVKQLLTPLWTSYKIFCRVLASFDILNEAGFCTSYYSILLENPNKNVAEIVKIPREVLDNIKTGIETATVQICSGESHPDEIEAHLSQCVTETCIQMLDILHLSDSLSDVSITSILGLCRTLALLADLGLVSYAGSHAIRFDLDYPDLGDFTNFTVNDGKAGSLYFDCRLRQLACLNSFLDDERVWVFRCSFDGPQVIAQKTDSDAALLILTHIEEFADIWGPVWSISPDQDTPDLIQQHNVSKGVICRVDEKQARKGQAIRCHWYDWTSFKRRRAAASRSMSKPLYLKRDDLLLIGARFHVNESCKYTLDQYEEDYGHDMAMLVGERSFWESELNSRTGGMSVSKIVGVTVSGTQKRRPQTCHKQTTLAKWKTSPQTANPGVLNQYLGVEISHCTGNARRARVKDLLLMKTFRPVLDLHFPRWFESTWGAAFLRALQSDDSEAIFKVWLDHESSRSDMAALVCYVFEILDITGTKPHGFVAAFFNNRQDLSVTLNLNHNDWSNLLRDSPLIATYAIVNEICIEHFTPDHSTSTCDGEPAYTVLGTRLGLRTQPHGDLIKAQPYGQVLKIIERVNPKTLLMTSSSSVSTASAYLRSTLPNKPMNSGVEIRDAAAKGGQQYDVSLRSSNKSLGGMATSRQQSQPNETMPTAIPIVSQPSDFGHRQNPRSTDNLPRPAELPILLNQDVHRETRVNVAHVPRDNTRIQTPRTQVDTMSLSSAGMSRPSEADSTIYASSLRTQNTEQSHTYNASIAPSSLMEDIANYQLAEFDDPSDPPANLLYDIENYVFDDEPMDDAGPSSVRSVAPSITDSTSQYLSATDLTTRPSSNDSTRQNTTTQAGVNPSNLAVPARQIPTKRPSSVSKLIGKIRRHSPHNS